MTTAQDLASSSPMIGVFDSGVGGLTVLRALRETLPHARYLYLGDTARLPYGSKSRETIARYAVESARFLVEQGAEYLVIACNTASALALPEIRSSVAVPVIGVIETGADAARASTLSAEGGGPFGGDVLVIATVATVASHAYRAACEERGMRALEKACPLLVPLVEEGWVDHPVTRDVLEIYLDELAEAADAEAMQPAALVLGCTHYPLLRGEIEALVPEELKVIDSAEVTAQAVAALLRHSPAARPTVLPPVRFFATDGVSRFRDLGSRFLGEPVEEVTLVDLGG